MNIHPATTTSDSHNLLGTREDKNILKTFTIINLGSIGASGCGATYETTLRLVLKAVDVILQNSSSIPSQDIKRLNVVQDPLRRSLNTDTGILGLCTTKEKYIKLRNRIILQIFEDLEKNRICFVNCSQIIAKGIRHAIVLKFILDETNNVEVKFSNRGYGSNLHGFIRNTDQVDTRVLSLVRLPKIPLERLKNSRFLESLCALSMPFLFNEDGSISNIRTKYETETDFYNVVIGEWINNAENGKAEIFPTFRGFQRGGTCALKSSTSFVREIPVSRLTEKRLKLQMRISSLQELLKSPLTPYQKFEIQWALAKISKTYLHIWDSISDKEKENLASVLQEAQSTLFELEQLNLETAEELEGISDPIITDPNPPNILLHKDDLSIEQTASAGMFSQNPLQKMKKQVRQPIDLDFDFSANALDLPHYCKTPDEIAVLLKVLAIFLQDRNHSPTETDYLLVIQLDYLSKCLNASMTKLRFTQLASDKFLIDFLTASHSFFSRREIPKKSGQMNGISFQFPPVSDDETQEVKIFAEMKKIQLSCLSSQESSAIRGLMIRSCSTEQNAESLTVIGECHESIWKAHALHHPRFYRDLLDELSENDSLAQYEIIKNTKLKHVAAALLVHALIGILHSVDYTKYYNYMTDFEILIPHSTSRSHTCSYTLPGRMDYYTHENYQLGALCHYLYPFENNQKAFVISILDNEIFPQKENSRMESCYKALEAAKMQQILQSEKLSYEEYSLLNLIGMNEYLNLPLWMLFVDTYEEQLENPLIGTCLENLLANRKKPVSFGSYSEMHCSVLQWIFIKDFSDSNFSSKSYSLANEFLNLLIDKLEKSENKANTRKILLRILGRSYLYLNQALLDTTNKNDEAQRHIQSQIHRIESILIKNFQKKHTNPLDQLTILSLHPCIQNSPLYSLFLNSLVDILPLNETALELLEKQPIPFQNDIHEALEEIQSADIPFWILKEISSILIESPHNLCLQEGSSPPCYKGTDGGINTYLIVETPAKFTLKKELNPGVFYTYSQNFETRIAKSPYRESLNTLSCFGSQPLAFWENQDAHILVYPRQNTSECLCSITSNGIQKGNDPSLHLEPLDVNTHTHPLLQRLFCIEEPRHILAWKNTRGEVTLIECPRYQFQLQRTDDSKWLFTNAEFSDAVIDLSTPIQELIPFSHYLIVKGSKKKIAVMPNTIFASRKILPLRNDILMRGSSNARPFLLSFPLEEDNLSLHCLDPSLLIHLFFLFLYVHEYEKSEKILELLYLHPFRWGEKETEILHNFFQCQSSHPYECRLRLQLLELKEKYGAPLSRREQVILIEEKQGQVQLFSHGLTEEPEALSSEIQVYRNQPTLKENPAPFLSEWTPLTVFTKEIPEQPLLLRCNKNFFISYFPALYFMAIDDDFEKREEVYNLLFRTRYQEFSQEESFMYHFLLGISNMKKRNIPLDPSFQELDQFLRNVYLSPHRTRVFEIHHIRMLNALYKKIDSENLKHFFDKNYEVFEPASSTSLPTPLPKKRLIRARKQLEEAIPMDSNFSFEKDPDLTIFLPNTHSISSETNYDHNTHLSFNPVFIDTVSVPRNYKRIKAKLKESLHTYCGVQRPEPVSIENPEKALQNLDQKIMDHYFNCTSAEQKFTDMLHRYEDIQLQMQLHVGLLKKMDLKEILVAFARHDDQKFLDSNPSLSIQDLIEIKREIAVYLRERTNYAHLIRIKQELELYQSSSGDEQKHAASKFYEYIQAQRAYDENNPHFQALLVFEDVNNMRLRREQVEALTIITSQNRLELEARTGFGKSDVLIPLWLFLTSINYEDLTVMVVPLSLLSDTESRLKKSLGTSFQQGVQVVRFQRKLTKNLSELKKFRENLEEAKRRKTIILIDIASLQGAVITALKTALYENATNPSPDKNALLEELWKISQLFKTSSRIFIDESRECTKPKQRYDYSIDEAVCVTESQIEHMFHFWNDIFLDDMIQSLWKFDFIETNPQALLTSVSINNIHYFQRCLAVVAAKNVFPHEDEREYSDHLIGNPPSARVTASLARLDEKTKNLYAFYRYQICLVRETLLHKYGDSYNLNEHYCAVPCERGEMKHGSVFSNLYSTLNYTMQANLKKNLEEKTVLDFIEKLKKPENFPHSTYAKAITFWEQIQRTCNLPALHQIQENDISIITKHINENNKLKVKFISIYILAELKTFPLQASGTSFNLLSVLEKVQLASGTPDPDTLPSQITSIPDRSASSLNALVAIRKKSSITTISSQPRAALTSILQDSDYKNGNSPPVIIDVGGVFSELSEEAMFDVLFQENSHIQGICYYVTETGLHGEPISKCMLKRRGSSPPVARSSSLLPEHQIGIFIRQGNIIGTDLPMPPTAKGYVTFDHQTNLNDLLQGASRLRLLNKKQVAILAATKNSLDIIKEKFKTTQITKIILLQHFLLVETDRKGKDYLFCLNLLLQNLIEQKLWEEQNDLQSLLNRFIAMKDLLIFSNTVNPQDLLHQNMQSTDVSIVVESLKKSVLDKIKKHNITFISEKEIDEIFTQTVDYEKLPNSVIGLISESFACATEIDLQKESEVDVNQNIDIDQYLSSIPPPRHPSFRATEAGFINYKQTFNSNPHDHFAGIEVYYSKNFLSLSTTPDCPVHKPAYFYLLAISNSKVKFMALDLYDAEALLADNSDCHIHTMKQQETAYYLISAGRVLAESNKTTSSDIILQREKIKLSLLNKILSGNSRMSSKEAEFLSSITLEESRSITTLIQKYQKYWPSVECFSRRLRQHVMS